MENVGKYLIIKMDKSTKWLKIKQQNQRVSWLSKINTIAWEFSLMLEELHVNYF